MSEIGEWTPLEPVTEEVNKICSQAKPDIESLAGTRFEVYTPLVFARLVLCGGTHYVVKVRVDGDVFLTAKICVVIAANEEMPMSVTSVVYPLL